MSEVENIKDWLLLVFSLSLSLFGCCHSLTQWSVSLSLSLSLFFNARLPIGLFNGVSCPY
jgi:hypothetical protein